MLGLLAALWLAGAAASAPAKAPPVKNPETFVSINDGEPDSLDPAWAQDTQSAAIILNVYETLFRFDGDAIVPLLAERVPSRENGLLSEDGRVYTIPIRAGVTFQDGTAMTAEDVAYSIKRFLLADRAAGPSWLLLNPLLGRPSTRDAQGRLVDSIWAQTEAAVRASSAALVLTLPRPYAPLLAVLAGRAPVVVSRRWAAAHGDWDGSESSWKRFNDPTKDASPFFAQANGTGPFALERWDRKLRQVVLRRYDGYWREPAKLKRAVIKTVTEFGTRKLQLLAGDADQISVSRSNLRQLAGAEGVTVVDGLQDFGVGNVVLFNFSISTSANPYIGSGQLDGEGVPPDFFQDRDVRQAFGYAIDYGRFVNDVLGGKGRQAAGFVPAGLLGHVDGPPFYRYDPLEAERLLRRAHGGRLWARGFRMTLVVGAGSGPRPVLCQMLKRSLEALNPRFKIEIRQLDWPAFMDSTRSGRLPLWVSGWSMKFADPHDVAFNFLHSKGFYPVNQRITAAPFDALIDAAYQEQDPERRQRLYEDLQSRAQEEALHLTVADGMEARVQRAWVKGWTYDRRFPGAPNNGYLYPLWKGM